MKWFGNLKLGTKLLSSFIIVALMAGLVGYIGISQINTVAQVDRALYEQQTLPLQEITAINDAFQRIRVNDRALMITTDITAKQKLIDDIFRYDNKIEENVRAFEKTVNTGQQRKDLDQLKLALKDLDNFLDTFTKLSLANKDSEANSFLQSQGPPIVDKIDSLVSTFIDLKMADAKATAQRNTSTAQSATLIMIILITIGVVSALALGFYISRSISRPIQLAAEAANKVAQGDLNVHLEIKTKDEIGALSKSFGCMVDNLNEILTEVNQASEQIAAGAAQVSNSSQTLSQASTEQASSVEEITATVAEIASHTKQNALNANKASELASTAKENAILGNHEMQTMLKAMQEINESSTSISKIIKVIDEIAFQTNILALNAAVEAARAGQHGKGFAVVAEEVRNLAARSANAAKETTVMIEGSIKKVEVGTRIANETALALNKIVEGINTAATLVGEIAIASNEQASSLMQINQGISGVSEVTQMNTATAQQSAAASEELASQADLLKTWVNKFNLRKTDRVVDKLKGVNPEVIAMLEKMMDKRMQDELNNGPIMTNSTHKEKLVQTSRVKINLDDTDFGKY